MKTKGLNSFQKIKMLGFQEGLMSLLPKQKPKRYILTGYRSEGIGLYTPRKNKFKVAVLGVLAIPFLITPFSNWVYLVGLNLLFKINPLWVFK